MLGSRIIRVAAAVFVGSAVAMLLWPRVTGYVSLYAVINAPVLTVRAPVDGVIARPSPGLAEPVRRDDVLIDLHATRASTSEIARLDAEVVEKSRQANALREEERQAARILEALRTRAGEEAETEIAFLSRKLDEDRSILRMHEVQWDRALRDFERLEGLAGRGTAAAKDVAAARSAVAEAEALMSADEARIGALLVELDAIERGLPSPAGTGRRDFGHDRIDDLTLALADIRSRREAAEGRRDGAARAAAALRAEFAGQTRFRPIASSDGVIWTASRQSGASVTNGSDLFQVLDCERRFIEVVFEERAFETLSAGTEATVRLRGTARPFTARVVSRHAAGGGMAMPAVDVAIGNPEESGNGVKVFLALEPADVGDPEVAQAFCDVGRTAEVQIRRPGVARLIDRVAAAMSRVTTPGTALLTADAPAAR